MLIQILVKHDFLNRFFLVFLSRTSLSRHLGGVDGSGWPLLNRSTLSGKVPFFLPFYRFSAGLPSFPPFYCVFAILLFFRRFTVVSAIFLLFPLFYRFQLFYCCFRRFTIFRCFTLVSGKLVLNRFKTGLKLDLECTLAKCHFYYRIFLRLFCLSFVTV